MHELSTRFQKERKSHTEAGRGTEIKKADGKIKKKKKDGFIVENEESISNSKAVDAACEQQVEPRAWLRRGVHHFFSNALLVAFSFLAYTKRESESPWSWFFIFRWLLRSTGHVLPLPQPLFNAWFWISSLAWLGLAWLCVRGTWL